MQGQYAAIRVARTSITSRLGRVRPGLIVSLYRGHFPESSLVPFYRLGRARTTDVQTQTDDKQEITKDRIYDKMKP